MNFEVKCQLHNIKTYFFEIPTSILYLWTPNTGFYDIYYQRYRIESFSSCLTLNFKVKGQGHDICIYFYEFRDIISVLIDTKISFYVLYYQRYHIECVTSCLTLNYKIKGHGLNHGTYLFEFFVIYLVIVDTKNKFMWHILPEISYWLRYVMFDLEFQSQRSRSQPWNLFVWIPCHLFSRNGHKIYVSNVSPSRDIEYCQSFLGKVRVIGFDLDLWSFEVIWGQKMLYHSKANLWLPIWLLWTPSLYLVTFSRYSTSKILGFDLDLWPLKVIWGPKKL